MAESLAKYQVELLAETTRYRAELEKANRTLQQFTKQQQQALDGIKTGFKILGAAVGAFAANNLGRFVKNSIDSADAAMKMSQQVGISVETITGLAMGLDLAGVSTAEFGTAVLRLSRAAASGNEAFAALGVSVSGSDGKLKSADQLLREVADKFAQMSDGARKAALSQDLFGRSGSKLIPFLNQGSAAFERSIEQSRELGRVWSQESAKAAEDFNDSITVLKTATLGYVDQLTQKALPSLNSFLVKIAEIAGLTGQLSPTLALTDQLEELRRFQTSLGQEMQKSAQGSPYYDALLKQFTELGQKIKGTQEALAFFNKQSAGPTIDSQVDAQAGLEAQAKATAAALRQEQAVMRMFNEISADTTRFARESEEQVAAMFQGIDRHWRESLGNVINSLRTEEEAIQESYARRLEIITANTVAGSEQQRQLVERLKDQTAEQMAAINQNASATIELADRIRSNVGGAIDEMFASGELSAGKFFESLLRDIARVATQLLIVKPLMESLFGPAGTPLGGLFGGVFGGARANGGQVSAGRSYLVGERGPELFMPSGAGRIVPNGGGGGGGTSVQIVDQRGASAPPVDVTRQMAGGMEQIRVLIRSEVGGMFGDGTIDRQFRAASMPVRRMGSR